MANHPPTTWCPRCDGSWPGPRSATKCPDCGCEPPRRRAQRPADLTGEDLDARREAYAQWGISARQRGIPGPHTCTNQWNDRCFCETQEQYDRRTMNK